MEQPPEPPKLLKCKKCGYQWYSNAKLGYVSCPNCYYKMKKEEAEQNG